jgi:peptidoglycan lytic transglycosylase
MLGLLLAGCASPPAGSSGGYPEGRGIGAYRVGSPYEIKGVWYYPAVDYNYDRTGVASWYGEEFEGRLTANGEIFDLNGLTAAHTTLPMPSIVQVTNLENGRSLQLRVNDRGPFVDGRLIDVSRRAAQLLGFENQGTTRVRVTVLKDESIAAAEEAMRNSGQVFVAQASGAEAATQSARRSSAPTYRVASAAPAARPLTPAPVRRTYEPRRSPPAQIAIASVEPPPERRQEPRPQIAMAPVEPPPTQPLPEPPTMRTASAARYRFSLISSAEAAELLAPRAPVRKREHVAASAPVAKMPPSPPRLAASARPAGRIFVQAGAFARRDNAERVEARIAHLGSVEVSATSVNGAVLYRVRLGPLASETQAHRLLARVVDKGFAGARVVGD